MPAPSLPGHPLACPQLCPRPRVFPTRPTHLPTHPRRRKLQEGDIVNVDVSVYYKGYHGAPARPLLRGAGGECCSAPPLAAGAAPATSPHALHARAPLPTPTPPNPGDLNETFTVGACDDDSQRLVQVTHDVSVGAAAAALLAEGWCQQGARD